MLESWVNHKAGNHDFPSIKVTVGSELKSSEGAIKEAKAKPTVQLLKNSEREVFVIPLESKDGQEFINQR